MDFTAALTATIAAIGSFWAGSAQEVGKQAVLDVYEKLKEAIKSKFGKESQSAKAMQVLEEDPANEGKQLLLIANLKIEKIDADVEIAKIGWQLAQALKQTQAGKNVLQKFEVDAKWAQIGGIGDHWQVENINLVAAPATRTELTSADWESFYLKRLIERCEPLELTTIEEICPSDGRQGQADAMRVSDVFTTLYLKDVERTEEQTVAEALSKPKGDPEKTSRPDEEKKRLPIQAIEAAGALPRLVILG